MGVTVNLSTDQKHYVAGDVVEGVVNLIIDATTPEGSSAKELTLRLVGMATTSVPNGERDTFGRDELSKDSDEFLSYEVQLASFSGEPTTGTHSFPFSVLLPPGLHSSMKEQEDSGGFCSIDYGFEASLHRPGILHFDVKAKSEVKVLSKPQETAPAVPVLAGPETQSVRYWCCFNRGSISLGFEADRSVVSINDPVKLTVVTRNDSTATLESMVESMYIEVEQVSEWRARNDKGKKKRTIASIVMSGSELNKFQDAMEEGDQRGRSEVADVNRQKMQEKQAAGGAATHHELFFPDWCLHSLESKLIDVSHTLSVKLVTSSYCMTDPELSVPLHMHAGSAVLDAPAETNPVGLSPVEVKAGEGLGLVCVPQAAVKPEFSCELPQQPFAPAN